MSGLKNVANEPLIEWQKKYESPVYIKLGFIKVFAKTLNTSRSVFIYLRRKFTLENEAKLKGEIFVVLQTRKLKIM